MIKRVCASIIMIGILSVSLYAQSAYVEFSYQTFRPFIHFQLNLSNSYKYYQNPYDTAYLKGYMDGVNDAYYNDYRFYDLVHDIDIYEAGYRDGYRDRDLMIQLRGINWYYQNRFAYNDYHSPYYSVQIWLGGLSMAFLQVPEQRLPRYWKRHAHPRFVKYRNWHKHRYRYNNREYRHFTDIERDYRKRLNRFRKEAYRERHRYEKKSGRKRYRTGVIDRNSKVDNRQARKRLRVQPKTQHERSSNVQSSRRNRAIGNSKVKYTPKRHKEIQSRSGTNSRIVRDRNDRKNKNKHIKRNPNRQREAIRSNYRDGKKTNRTFRKENNRKKSRGTFKKDRSEKRGQGRKTRKGRGNNG